MSDYIPTFFEQQVRAAVEISGWTYADLSNESGVAASQIGRFMAGSRGLSSDGLGRILDCLGCTLSAPTKRREIKRVRQGRPKKPVFRVEIPPEQMRRTLEIDHLKPKRQSEGDREIEFEVSPQPTDETGDGDLLAIPRVCNRDCNPEDL
jgi:hypothetical protein